MDNIGDNWHNLLSQLSIFLTEEAAGQSFAPGQFIEKAALLELCRKPDKCGDVGRMLPNRGATPALPTRRGSVAALWARRN